MDDVKERVIKNSVDDYKKLPKDKQMFVLGYMQGVLCNRSERQSDERQLQEA